MLKLKRQKIQSKKYDIKNNIYEFILRFGLLLRQVIYLFYYRAVRNAFQLYAQNKKIREEKLVLKKKKKLALIGIIG